MENWKSLLFALLFKHLYNNNNEGEGKRKGCRGPNLPDFHRSPFAFLDIHGDQLSDEVARQHFPFQLLLTLCIELRNHAYIGSVDMVLATTTTIG